MRSPHFLLPVLVGTGLGLTVLLAVKPAFSQDEAEFYDNGQMYLGQKKYPEAEAEFRKSITTDPRYKEAWQGLADTLKAQGQEALAAKVQRMADEAPAARAGEAPPLTAEQKQILVESSLAAVPLKVPKFTPKPKTKPVAKPPAKMLTPQRPVAAKTSPAPTTAIALKAMAPRRGYIIGRAVTESGKAIPRFTLQYSGFEDGKLANYSANGYAMETVSGTLKATNGRYAIKVPPGAYRVSGYVTYSYKNRLYNFELEPRNPPKRHDYDNLGLDKLKSGLVRDFVLKMTARKPGASDETETVYKYAYYGGRVDFDAGEVNRILGGGHQPDPPLRDAYAKESVLTITLTPSGPLVDGSTGRPIVVTKTLGQAGQYTFSERGIYPGVYSATAMLTTPEGTNVPLRVSNKPSRWISKGSPDGYDMVVMDWKPSVTLDFLPNDLGPVPRMGVNALTLYLGK